MWRFERTKGELSHDGKFVAFGYSGFGEGKNNPALQDHHDLGPLPAGKYTFQVIRDAAGNAIEYEHKKPPVLRLFPHPENQMFGRAGFLIHGDSISAPGTASHGCVIESHQIRELLAQSEDKELEVV